MFKKDFLRSASIAAAALLLTGAQSAIAQVVYPLQISSDGRTLEDQTGEPFLINGDTPWSLIVGLTKAEAELYLEDRRARGFNAIIVELIENEFGGPANRDGDLPFTTPGDFTTPNEAYFAHADWVIDKAAEKGLLVVLTPAYLGFGCGSQGWCQEMLASSDADLEAYGAWVATRYRDFDNVLWMHGGDTNASEYGAQGKVDAIVNGILSVETEKLHTSHCDRQRSAVDCYDEPWLQVNNTYSDCNSSAARTRDDYNRQPSPFFYSEGTYDGEGASDRCLRSQAYWSILGGSTGHFYGNNPIWLFDPGWQSDLDTTGAQSMMHLAALFASRPWYDLVPDYNEVFVSGDRRSINGSGYVAAARSADGGLIMVYMPQQRTVTIDMASVSGSQARAWWFDPSDGSNTDLGTFATSGSSDFTPPSGGDWILVIDNNDLGRGAPGTDTGPPADTTPPAIDDAATTVGEPNFVGVSFSEPVETASAENASNYGINGGVSVVSASLQSSLRDVLLQTSDLSDGLTYTLTVNGVRDRANPPNTIPANTTAAFTYNAGAGGGGPANYVWAQIGVGSLVYIDDTTVFQTVPATIDGEQFLRTAAVDSMASGSPFTTITLSERSSVFVAYDERNTTLPTWMAAWTSTGEGIDIGAAASGPRETTLDLYSQDFDAGSVDLGGNEMGNSMYVVVVKPVAAPPPPPPNPAPSSGSGSSSVWLIFLLLLAAAVRGSFSRES